MLLILSSVEADFDPKRLSGFSVGHSVDDQAFHQMLLADQWLTHQHLWFHKFIHEPFGSLTLREWLGLFEAC